MAKRPQHPFYWRIDVDRTHEYIVLNLHPSLPPHHQTYFDPYLWECHPSYYHRYITMRAQASTCDPTNWYSVDYGMDTQSMNCIMTTRQAEAYAKTLKRIEKGILKLNDTMGSANTLAQKIIYLSQAIGKECQGHIIPKNCPNGKQLRNNSLIEHTLQEILKAENLTPSQVTTA